MKSANATVRAADRCTALRAPSATVNTIMKQQLSEIAGAQTVWSCTLKKRRTSFT